MPTQVQFRRGNTSQHSTFTGAEGEITVNTEKDILVVHDGSTVGGHEVARVNNPYFNGTVNVANVTFSNSLHPNSNGTHSIGNGTFRWEKLWLSNAGISIGTANHTITTNTTTFIFTQNVTTNDSFMVVQGATVGPVVNTSGFYGNVTANALNVGGDVTITGNLVVTGTTLTVNTTTLDVKDLNITVAKGALDASAANGAGITIDGANATILYIATTNTFNFSNYVTIGNSSVNATINATSFTGDAATVGGNSAANLNLYASDKAANAYANAVSYTDGRIIDSVTNTSTAYAASANSVKNAYDRAIDANTRAASAQTEATSAYSNATSYADTKAATAYSNAVSYTDGRIIDSVTNTSIAYAASANSVKNAYDRAIDANTRAASAQTEASAAYTNAASYADTKAATAYSNATSYTDAHIIDSVTNTSIAYAASANSVKNAYDRAIDANTRAASAQTEASAAYSNAASYADTKAATAYSNATAYTDTHIIDSVTNTSIAYAASANSVKNAYDRAIDANTRAASAQTEASAAYSNAIVFASNANNVNTGTLAETRLPYRMNQDLRTTDNVTFNDLAVTGNLTLSGNTLIVGANNLIVSDSIISLHTPANLAALTSNDGKNIGLAFHYYDTEDKHALLYRDNTTGYLQYHTDGSDPISNTNPTGNSFGTIQAASFWAGNSSVYSTVNNTNYTGTSNNSLYLGGTLAASYIQNTDSRTLSGNLVISGTYFNPSANTILLGNSTQRWIVSANTIDATGQLTAVGGSKLVVQASQDGGSSRGIFMYDSANTDWGIYMASSGANKSLSNGTAGSTLGGSTNIGMRFRASEYSGGFIWENNAETQLAFLEPFDGDLYLKGYAIGNGLTIKNPVGLNTNTYASIQSTGQVRTALEYVVIANSSGVIGSGSTTYFKANTTGAYHTGTVNAASFTVGTTVISNSTGVFVGANVSSTVTTITVGNSTVNTAVTAGVIGRTDVQDTFISNTTATVSQTAIDSFSATTYRSAKYIIQATNGSSYHYTEVAVIHDGTTASATEFATMFTGSSLVSFAVDISAGDVRLLATAANATTTTYKIDRKLIKV